MCYPSTRFVWLLCGIVVGILCQLIVITTVHVHALHVNDDSRQATVIHAGTRQDTAVHNEPP
jgi:hypothetical protein